MILDVGQGRRDRDSLGPRARSLVRRVTRGEMVLLRIQGQELATELAEAEETRPRTRSDCEGGPRPCPWVGCRHHLYLDVSPTTGTIKLNYPDLEPEEIPTSCSLDIADQGDHTLERVGELMNLTRERVRQVETKAKDSLRSSPVVRTAGPAPGADQQ